MPHKFKRFISIFILAVIAFNGIALMRQEAYAAVSPQKVNDAVDKFVTAVGKFAAKDATQNIGKIADFCNRLGGLTSVASGVIGILQMTGVIKDPTLQMIGKVLDAVKDVQTTLDNMNKTLNQIAQSLINIQVAQQEIDRNNKATTMSTNWNNFNTNYTEKLTTYVNEYEAKINTGIQNWWNQASHEGVYVLMTKKYTEENSLTYSKKKYSEGLPATSDINNETVSTEWSIGIPADYMPNTKAVAFNINTYRDDFKKMMVTALENAIKDSKLASNCGASVKSEYSGSSKQAMLENYADNVMNTVIYKIACEVMTANNSWVSQVISTYNHYCDNILQQNSGINAFLNYIFFTHAFEGEVKDDIEKFCDGMVTQAGFYGQFALTCAGQDSLQATATKEQIRDNFTNTVISINNRKAKAITGNNNYCYITGTILKEEEITISSHIYLHRSDSDTFTGCDAKDWQASVPSIVNSVYLPIIYKQYTRLPQGTNSFGEYLHKYGVQSVSTNTTYMTSYNGVQTFGFGEGIYMKADGWTGGDYFSNGSYYHIDVGTGSKVEQQYYHCHDKVMGDWFDSSNGSQSLNAIIAARALYGESHWTWSHDETWAFYTDTLRYYYTEGYHYDKWLHFERAVHILKSTACHDLNGDEVENPENPFFAFDQATLTTGVSDQMDLQYENTSKDITEILLDSESFPYTGQPVEPAVTVLCSEDIVPEDGYTVTYINNIESGDYAVVRVEGKGDYTGVISRHFTITGNSSEKRPGSSGGGCNTMSCAGLMLGLVFVIRKIRRR